MSPGTINIRDEKVLYSTFWAIPMMDDRLDRSSVTVSVWLFVALFCSSSTPVQQHFLHTTPSHGSDQSGCVTPGGEVARVWPPRLRMTKIEDSPIRESKSMCYTHGTPLDIGFSFLTYMYM